LIEEALRDSEDGGLTPNQSSLLRMKAADGSGADECPVYVCAKAALSSGCEPHPARSLQPEATGAVMEVTIWLKPSV